MNLNPVKAVRRSWVAWQNVKDQPITTKVKHAILVAGMSVFGVVGCAYQLQQINERNQRDDQQTIETDAYRTAVDIYVNQVNIYEDCLGAVEIRQAVRADNERDNALLTRFVNVMDFYLDDDSSAAIADLLAVIDEGAALDDKERPEIDVSSCPVAPTPPLPPELR